MRIAAAVFVILTCIAQPFAPHARAADVPPIRLGPAITTRLQWIHCNMLSGRVVATSAHVGTNLTTSSTSPQSGRRESLAIDISYALPNLQLEVAMPSEQFKLILTEGNRLTIERRRPAEAYALEFEQKPDQPLQLTLVQAGAPRSWKAASFWHLWLAEPELVNQHLVPLLELLHPSWQLSALGAGLEEALFGHAEQGQNQRQLWDQFVDDLASSNFAARQNAQRELVRAGQVVVPYLQNLRREGLDAEQAGRIRAIVATLSIDFQDSIDRLTPWLAGDDQIWLALLSRRDLDKRQIAAKQLSKLLGSPIDFDPDATETERQLQLERLQQSLNGPAAIPRS